jgi:hypothetical protein
VIVIAIFHYFEEFFFDFPAKLHINYENKHTDSIFLCIFVGMKEKNFDYKESILAFGDNLREFHLKTAFKILRRDILPQCNNGHLREDGQTLCDSYDLMLESAARGKDDPDRRRIFEQICKWGFELVTRLKLDLEAARESDSHAKFNWAHVQKESQSNYYPCSLIQKMLEENYAQFRLFDEEGGQDMKKLGELMNDHLTNLNVLFTKIWGSWIWTEGDAHEMHQIAQSAAIRPDALCVMSSILMISVIHHFDERKFLELVSLCGHGNLLVSQRSLVNVCLVLSFYCWEMPYLDSVWSALDVLSSLPHIEERLQTIQLDFAHAYIAPEIAKQMQGNMIPVVTRESRFIQEELARYREDGEEGDLGIKISKHQNIVNDKMNIIDQWLRLGEDVYLSSFSALKQHEFFKDPTHWFLPFDPRNNYVRDILGKFEGERGETIRYLMESVVFCDSDKYSFAFALEEMNESQIGMLVQQLNDQREALMDNVTFLNSTRHRSESMEEITRCYVQDLNRFFRCQKLTGDCANPLGEGADFFNYAPTYRLVHDYEIHYTLAKLMRKWHRHMWAGMCYKALRHKGLHLEECDKWLVEDRIEEQDYSYAYTHLKEMLNKGVDPLWTINHLVQCMRHVKNVDIREELYFLKRWTEIDTDNDKAAIAYGKALVQNLDYEEALPHLYRWEFTAKEPLEAYRNLVWTLINLRRDDEAKRFSDKVLNGPYELIYDDWINAGHIALLRGDFTRALECYRRAIPLCPGKDLEDIPCSVEELQDLIPSDCTERLIDLGILRDILSKEVKESQD